MEVSLSRAFFNPFSNKLKLIDSIISSIQNISNEEFSQNLIQLCYDIIPKEFINNSSMQSIALLLLFRCFFNRAYEKYPTIFKPKFDNIFLKLEILSKMKCKNFLLPFSLISNISKDLIIHDVFKNDKYFFSASLFLFNSIFYSKQIDSLFFIHKTLISIRKAALINRLGPNIASIDDVHELLCFDDLFSLFFGTYLGSDFPDIFYLSWFIDNFIPKQCLSPSFEYALANLNALVTHIQKFEITKIDN